VKVNIDGQMYDYDDDALTMAEAFELKEKTGFGLRAFYEAWVDKEPAALAWMAYLARTRAGETVDDWKTSVSDVGTFVESILAGGEQEAADASDPAAGQTASA
jgi:hypothetical protein